MNVLSKRPQAPRASGAVASTARSNLESAPQCTTNSLGMQLVELPAGEFWMGNHESAQSLAAAFPQYESERIADLSDEWPLHRVRFRRPLLMARHAVTVGQFRAFVEAAGYESEAHRDRQGGWGYNPELADFEGRRPHYSWRNPGFAQDDRHPVVNVTWHDAVALCDWLSQREGRRYRLPTEAEWEYACRAGSRSRYHTGDDPEALVAAANFYDAETQAVFPQWSRYAVAASDGCAFTAPVGSYQPNAFGLCDMHGNVWEWCADWYAADYYERSPLDDPRGPESGDVRVRRGGSWHSWPLYLRASYRNWNRPDTRYVLLGFRLACEVG